MRAMRLLAATPPSVAFSLARRALTSSPYLAVPDPLAAAYAGSKSRSRSPRKLDAQAVSAAALAAASSALPACAANPLNDIVFRAVFSQSDVLVPFLNDVLSLGPGKSITGVTLRSREFVDKPAVSDSKRKASFAKKAAPAGEDGPDGAVIGEVDVTCVLNTGEGCIVEIQHAAEPNFLRRLLLYGALDMVKNLRYALDHASTSSGIRMTASMSDLPSESFVPVHLVALCSFDFHHDAANDRLAVTRAKSDALASNSCIQVYRMQADVAAISAKSGPGKIVNRAAEVELGKLLSITLVSLPRCPSNPSDAVTDVERWGSILSHTNTAVNMNWRSWPAKYHSLMSAVTAVELVDASAKADQMKHKYQQDAMADAELAKARADGAEARADNEKARADGAEARADGAEAKVSQLLSALAAAGIQPPASVTGVSSKSAAPV